MFKPTSSFKSPPCPNSDTRPRPRLINRPLRNPALTPHALNHLLQPRLNYNTTHDHLPQHRMQCLKIENQIQLAHILKQPVQRLDKDLDQIEERER